MHRYPAPFILLTAALTLAAYPLTRADDTPAAKAGDSAATKTQSLAEMKLTALVDREKELWKEVGTTTDKASVETLKGKFQDVLNGYAGLIRDDPEFVPTYVAYGLLLNKVGERGSSKVIFAKANELDPNLPIVKNELANFLFEDGQYQDALPLYLAAIRLAPKEPLYHYELGTLLAEYKKFFVADGMFTADVVDRQMQNAFRNAADLAPDKQAFAYRYAESFYDLTTPDWPAALTAWQALEAKEKTPLGKQTIDLHIANVLLKEGKTDDARTILAQVTATDSVIQSNKAKLLKALNQLKPAEQASAK